ncbi:Crp/Fnr family transcriptional regulator [Lacihabitans soyangensis]|uniref:Crp/Fnr family transcriptional regulator n=1 Tax=Lacihabitans soyangensis TaxID=869394 RepID=A0AAE3H1E3_9BACT|nr:Crp/Fnr family transcriptional regulator [Lacihabitans soyangensis]MCP9762500.1 Crp/Fnr family transcriptional regulator [Lacihabitans soyangensis]
METAKNQLIDNLKAIFPFGKTEEEAISSCLTPFTAKKREFLLKKGDVCDKIYFLMQGAIREFILDKDQKEITVWFGFEGDIVVSLSSLVYSKGSHTGLQALEDSKGFYIEKPALDELYAKFHTLERMGRIVTEKYLLSTETYHYDFHYLTANERFEKLQKDRMWIYNRVPLHYIASYLGVSNETLSRIRAKKS